MRGLIILAATLAALSGCGQKSVDEKLRDGEKLGKGEEVPFATVEEQRAQGRSNALASAMDYQRQNPRIQGWEVVVKSDTSHSAKCPQGDGWAEVVFMRAERAQGDTKNVNVERAVTMCSTVSLAQGCVMMNPTDNWSKHPGHLVDGSCASTFEVPFPLPKVVGAR